MKLSGMEALKDLISTFPPSLTRVYPTDSSEFYRWEFWYPSGSHETVVLSDSQSSAMASVVASISEIPSRPPSSSEAPRKLFQLLDSAQQPTVVP